MKHPPPPPPPPTAGTLAGYGLTAADWYAMCARQAGLCPVCGEAFGGRKLAVDHEHVKGWRARKTKRRKGKSWKVRVMTPEERRVHVRGILHAYCNRFVRSWLTLPRAERICEYLRAHAVKQKKAR